MKKYLVDFDPIKFGMDYRRFKIDNSSPDTSAFYRAMFLAQIAQEAGDSNLALGLFASFIYPPILEFYHTGRYEGIFRIERCIEVEGVDNKLSTYNYKIILTKYEGISYYISYDCISETSILCFLDDIEIVDYIKGDFATPRISSRQDAILYNHTIEDEVLHLFLENRLALDYFVPSLLCLSRASFVRLRYSLRFLGCF